MTAPRPKLFLIGAGGFVGSCLAALLRDRLTVVRGLHHAEAQESDAVAIDITDAASVSRALEQARPDVVLLTAAIADIDRCQREPEVATAVNVTGARHVAQACQDRAVRFLFTSTDNVFAGTADAYRESDPTNPIHSYGTTKVAAEKAVLESSPSALILRLTLVLGRSAAPGKNSYLDRLAQSLATQSLAAGQPVFGYTFEHRNPIDVRTLADYVVELIARPEARGILHVGAADCISRFELARRIAQRLGFDESAVQPTDTPAAGSTPRPRQLFLASDRMHRYCQTPAPTCDEVIERALRPIA